MKKLILALALTFVVAAQPISTPSITLTAFAPQPVGVVSLNQIGTTGQTTYYYWVVAVYAGGKSLPRGPLGAFNSANTLSVSNYNQILWNAIPNVTGYDVLRTTTPSLPSGAATIAVVAATTSTTVNDQGGALSSYTVTAGTGASTTCVLDNVSSGTPTVSCAPYSWGSGGGGSGTVTNIATTTPIAGGPITTTGTVSCPTCTTNGAGLTANQLMIGAGGQASQALGSLGTTTTVLHGNAAGAPTFGAVNLGTDVTGNLGVANLNGGSGASAATFWSGAGVWGLPLGTLTGVIQSTSGTPSVVTGSAADCVRVNGTSSPCTNNVGTVTSVGFTGGLISVATATTTPALTVAGTSGGIPYFSSSSAWASSAALTANLPVIGGGAGVAPTVGTRSGNTTAYVTTAGTQTAGRCVEIDANGNHIASAAGCASGAGTVTVVGGGSLTSTALVTGGGTTTLQTPSATATMDSSGNVSTPGSVSTGVGGSVAGALELGQGTAPTAGTNSVKLYGNSAITSYLMRLPSAAATGLYLGTNTAGDVVMSQVAVASANTASAVVQRDGSGNFSAGTVTAALTGTASGNTVTIASGTKALDTDAILTTACDTLATTTATGVASTDTIIFTPNADITGVTGYAPVTTGGLAIYAWPTTNTINWKVCNPTSSTITPGAVTLNYRVVR